MPKPTQSITILYDGDCPFCKNYCKLLRIKTAAGTLDLINARHPSALLNEVNAKAISIDHGMVVKIGDTLHHGADALHTLALLSTRSGLFNRITYWIFQSKTRTAALYPILRGCRNLALWLMRISPINPPEKT